MYMDAYIYNILTCFFFFCNRGEENGFYSLKRAVVPTIIVSGMLNTAGARPTGILFLCKFCLLSLTHLFSRVFVAPLAPFISLLTCSFANYEKQRDIHVCSTAPSFFISLYSVLSFIIFHCYTLIPFYTFP